MREMIEQQEAFEEVDILAEGNLAGYESAREMFKSGKMPDGTKWSRSKVKPYAIINGGFVARKIKYKPHGEKMTGSLLLDFSPGGKNGHGGVTIDATASNQFLILEPAGTQGLLKAFAETVKRKANVVRAQIEKWVKTNDREWFGRIVGVDNVDDWTVTNIKLRRVKFGGPDSNHPNRRKWPSGRSEIAMPFGAEVQVAAKRK